MNPPAEPNPYEPSQVASQADSLAEEIDWHRLVGRFHAWRTALSVIFASFAAGMLAIAFTSGGLNIGARVAPLALLLTFLAVGYCRAWYLSIFAGALLTTGFTVSLVAVSMMFSFLDNAYQDLMPAIIGSPILAPVSYFALRTLRASRRIGRAGYPLTVTSLELIHAAATESPAESG